MSRQRATVRQVASDSFLILINGYPVHQTTDADAARMMGSRLQQLLREPRPLDSIAVRLQEGRYAVTCHLAGTGQAEVRFPRELLILEVNEENTAYAWLQASVFAENLRHALRAARAVGDVIPLQPTDVTVKHEVLEPVKQPNPSPEEHLPRLETLLQRLTTDSGTVFLYTKLDDLEHVYAALGRNGRLFDLTAVSDVLNWEGATADIVKIVPEPIPFLRLQGVIGANTLRTIYYRMDRDVPQPVLEVDGNVTEIDLDNNGYKEVILSSGIPSITIIYTWAQDRFQEANINITLKAPAVQLNEETKRIDAFFGHETVAGTRQQEKKSYENKDGNLGEVAPTP